MIDRPSNGALQSSLTQRRERSDSARAGRAGACSSGSRGHSSYRTKHALVEVCGQCWGSRDGGHREEKEIHVLEKCRRWERAWDGRRWIIKDFLWYVCESALRPVTRLDIEGYSHFKNDEIAAGEAVHGLER